MSWIWRFDDIELNKLELVETGQDSHKIEKFIQILNEGYNLSPIKCQRETIGGPFYVWDGHHRVLAYRAVGKKTIEAEMRIWIDD